MILNFGILALVRVEKLYGRHLGLDYHKYRKQLRTTLAHIESIAVTVDL